MSIKACVEAFCTMLREATGASIDTGRLQDATGDIRILPWQYGPDAVVRDAHHDPFAKVAAPTPFRMHLLVLAAGPTQAEQLARLDAVADAVRQNPLLHIEGARVRVVSEALDPALLTQVFQAVQAPLALCVPVSLQVVFD